MALKYANLSDEQQMFVDLAMQGYNVLVDACIGSGKTTAIQTLCELLPCSKRILYLTYNRLLKVDAQAKILTRNAKVQNYHGFAYCELMRNGFSCSSNDCVALYSSRGILSSGYNVLIIDEYQDIELDIATMLCSIKRCNPGLQIIVVGDMAQKILDKTSLDVQGFISSFIGSCYRIEFTRCFRLGKDYAAWIGSIWNKKIVGVNPDFRVRHMSFSDTLGYLSEHEPRDILCLGSEFGPRVTMLNMLEESYGHKFNKYTVWSKIGQGDRGSTSPNEDAAIFTTYDGCKGMERDIAVVFNWTEKYWESRAEKPMMRYDILRNIFCVAASRGKREIIFCDRPGDVVLTDKVLKTDFNASVHFGDVNISEMFDYKFIEHVEAAYRELDIEEVRPAGELINAKTSDGNIDLSPCLGVYQEVGYFVNTDIDVYIESYLNSGGSNNSKSLLGWKTWPLKAKVLYYTSLVTGQNRYLHQVNSLFTDEEWSQVRSRLSSELPVHSDSQVRCSVSFSDGKGTRFRANGFCDIFHEGVVYELKFVSELSHTHCLQLAMYLAAMNIDYGYLWNVRDNRMLKISIRNKDSFMDRVVTAVTKGVITKAHYNIINYGYPDSTGDDIRSVAVNFGNGMVKNAGSNEQDARNKAGAEKPVVASTSVAKTIAKSKVPAKRSSKTDIVTDVGLDLDFYYKLLLEMEDAWSCGFRFGSTELYAFCKEHGKTLPFSDRIFFSYFVTALQVNLDKFSREQSSAVLKGIAIMRSIPAYSGAGEKRRA